MSFRPISDRHAIHEVVFVLHFSRPFQEAEIGRLEKAHEQWKSGLPKASRTSVYAFGKGPVPPGFAPIGGVSFDRYKTDGSLDLRLRAEDDWLAVNCLNYTRWKDIWGQARDLLQKSSHIVKSDGLLIQSVSLQYIDIFEWEGNVVDYSIDLLFSKDETVISNGVWGRGPLWHSHQGWLVKEGLLTPGAMLERIHLDGTQDQKKSFVVKLDHLLRLKTSDGPGLPYLSAETNLIDELFDDLHKRNKELLGKLLTSPIKDRISLDV